LFVQLQQYMHWKYVTLKSINMFTLKKIIESSAKDPEKGS